ncbi:RNAse P Rpr2/Rpp21/SNM1 subunit domain-containing protein [Aspergillus cavernicola]|uniref:RNAse P Rpr2/Rpp21/SNM1 subunit domain-containing protein n=1 Tax=Aspergillus cavernicola TaxID=176166 RepID=A0ABR4IR81_9EURO
MAKAKNKKGSCGGVNSHIRARLNYLHKAATYLQTAKTKPGTEGVENISKSGEDDVMSDSKRIVPLVSPNSANTHDRTACLPQLARVCISQIRGVSLKSQLRLPIEQKRSFCKRCDTLLVSGTNFTEEIRNPSRGSRKPWAEVRVIRCNICRTEKRFPRTDKRSRKLSDRRKDQQAKYQSEATKPT